MTLATTSQSFFEAKYQQSEDPWDFAASSYEQQRYDAILAAVLASVPATRPGCRYRRAFEPGCSVGALTEKLAAICDDVEAMDISPTAVARACSRTRHLQNVQTTCGTLPAFIPSGTFDLIVFSEIGYYFAEDDLLETAKLLAARSRTSGLFLAAHWLGESPDHLLFGDRVHEILARVPRLELRYAERHPGFRLDVWVRV